MEKLTQRQQKVLKYIENYLEANGESPSLFEIRDYLGVKALSTVHKHIRAIESKGYLQRDTNSSRGINYVMNAGKYIGEFIKIPMVGTIIAGRPIDAVEEISDYVHVAAGDLDRSKEYYALTVKGDSMIDSYIVEGDLIIAEKTTVVKDGDMVVALTPDGEATLKHFFAEKKQIRLQPANKKYKPLYYPKGELQIQGKVVQVLRHYLG